MQSTRRVLVASAAAALVGLSFTTTKPAGAATAAELTANAKTTLASLYAKQPQARKLGEKARAILVFPRIIKIGLIAGGQSGDGVLLQNGRAINYYNISAGSFGLQAGAQTFSYVLFFMNEEALQYLDRSDGWSVGSMPNVVVANEGIARSISSTTLTEDVYAFPFGLQGLMAGVGLEGSKITRINPPR